MQQVPRILAVVFLLAALLLAVIAYAVHRRPPPPLQAERPPASAPVATNPGVPVVFARLPLPAGQPIDPSWLAVERRPQAPAEGYRSIEALSHSIPLIDIPAGTALRSGLIMHGIVLALKPGERAIAVPLDTLASAGDRIVAGSYVDVFASYRPASQPGSAVTMPSQDDTWNRLLLPHTRVLAVGMHDLPELDPAPAVSAPATPGLFGGQRTASTEVAATPARDAVLAVPLALVNQLLLASQNGKLVLALRNPLDSALPDPDLFPAPPGALAPRASLTAAQRNALASPGNKAFAGTDLRAVSGMSDRSPPARRPRAAAPTIEVIRGDLASAHLSAQ